MPTYLGYEVLDRVPDGYRNRDDVGEREFTILGGFGARKSLSLEPVSRVTRSYRWPLTSTADTVAFKAFLDAVKGRLKPFWLPTFERDLTLSGSIPFSSSTEFDVVDTDYGSRLFPYPARRHIQIYNTATGNTTRKKVVQVVPGSGVETLKLNETAGQSGSTFLMLMFLRFCRLADDVVRIVWESKNYGVCTLRITEIPGEVPE